MPESDREPSDHQQEEREKYFKCSFSWQGPQTQFDVYVSVPYTDQKPGEVNDMALEAAVAKFREIHGPDKTYTNIAMQQTYNNAVVSAREMPHTWQTRFQRLE